MNVEDLYNDAGNASANNSILELPNIEILRNKKFRYSDNNTEPFSDIESQINGLNIDLDSKIGGCDYYTDNLDKIYDKNVDCLSLMFHNISSLPCHFDEYSTFINSDLEFGFDFLALSETKLTADIVDLYKLNNYVMYNQFTSRNSGGVAMYVSDRYANHTTR